MLALFCWWKKLINDRRLFFRSEEDGSVCKWLPPLPDTPDPPSLHADGPPRDDGARHGESLGHSPGHEHDARSPWQRHRSHLPKVSGVISLRARFIRCLTRHYKLPRIFNVCKITQSSFRSAGGEIKKCLFENVHWIELLLTITIFLYPSWRFNHCNANQVSLIVLFTKKRALNVKMMILCYWSCLAVLLNW